MSVGNPKVQSCQALLAETTLLFHELRGLSQRVHQDDEATAARSGLMRSLILAGPQTVPEIARSRSVTRQSVQQIVNQLKVKGYVEARENIEHRRSHLIAATDEGQQWFEGLIRREAEYLVDQDLPLSVQEIWGLVVGLRKMRDFFSLAALDPKEKGRL